ncbi:MAG: AMP-binding protein, partial [Pseudolabrys sp.]
MHQPVDIRNLTSRRSVTSQIVDPCTPGQLQPDLRSVIEPIQRNFGRPQVITREHTNNAVRWKQGERLSHLLEEACIRFATNDAVIADGDVLTYRELDCRANQVARYLIDQGIQAGNRVGLLFDKSSETYVAMLAVMKVNAAYVPLDSAFPAERIRFIIDDAEIKAIVSMSSFDSRLASIETQKVFLDTAKPSID